jgi:hypothetical protein
MSSSAHLAITIVVALIGAIAPFRALIFTRQADPATEAIDLLICPFYVLGRFLSPMGDFGSTVFFIAAVIANAALYGAVAHYFVRTVSTVDSPNRSRQSKV